MEKLRTYIPLNFEKKEGTLPILLRFSKIAKAFFKKRSLSIRITVDSEGNISSSVDADPETLSAAKKMGLQFRGQFLIDGFEIRKVDFSKLHNVQNEDLLRLVRTLEIKPGQHILDMMCGYGAVSEVILQQTTQISLSMCDLHQAQLDLIPKKIREQSSDITVGDARSAPYPDQTFDSIVIKMGVHDVPQYDQPLIFQEAYRMLKPGGNFVIWDVMPDSGAGQDAFMRQIQKKDELAGYESLTVDRYFYRGDQVVWLYQNGGFINVEEVFSAHFREGTQRRLADELQNDQTKLDELNAFTRKSTPESVKKEFQDEDTGDDIRLTVPNRVFRGKKPR